MWTAADRFTIISAITSLARTYTRLTVCRGNCGCQRCNQLCSHIFKMQYYVEWLDRNRSSAKLPVPSLFRYRAICIIRLAIFIWILCHIQCSISNFNILLFDCLQVWLMYNKCLLMNKKKKIQLYNSRNNCLLINH